MPTAPFRVPFYRLSLILLCLLCFVPRLVLAQPEATPRATPIAPVSSLPHYDIAVTLDASAPSLIGELALAWTNQTGHDQDYLYFRLYPNASYYRTGNLDVTNIRIDGKPVVSALADDPTVLQLTPPARIPRGASITIAMRFVTSIPVDTPSSFGVFQYAKQDGVWNLANWYPILAGWEPGNGWYLQEPTIFGDPTFSETASYSVTLTAPDNLTVVATGATTSVIPDSAKHIDRTTIATGPAREFAMTLLENAAPATRTNTGDITVRVTLPESQDIPGLASFMGETAARALSLYASWMGTYPEPEFDLTIASLSGANGVSWSGMTWFDLEPITRDGTFTDEERTGLAFVILHEVGHQWIASIIGSNNNDHGFMSEGLVNALAVLAAGHLFGSERADLYLRSWVAGPYSSLLNDKRDGIADAPLTNDTNGVIRSLLIYGKAAIGFIAIREEIGETAFLQALGAYAQEFRFGISTPEDLRSAFETEAGASLATLWSFWFNEQTATSADLTAILDAFTGSLATPIAA